MMMKCKTICRFTYMYGVCIHAIFTAIIVLSFLYFVTCPNHKSLENIEINYKTKVINRGDSLTNRELIDNMYQLSERYREETSNMIDKGSAWNGFWITVIFGLLGASSIIQFKENRENSRRLEKTFREFNEEKNRHINELKRATNATKISTIAQCLMTLPDAQMSSDDVHMRTYIKKYFITMCNTFDKYVSNINEIKDLDKLHSEIETARILVTMLRNSISRTQNIFSSADTSIEFYEVNQEIKYLLQKMLSGISNERTLKSDLVVIAEKLAKIRLLIS